jgi:hypothetical protein
MKAEDFSPRQVTFSARSPHFDFGHGLAPFAVFRVPSVSSPLGIEVEAYLELVGWAYGGDGNARYWDAHAIFLDASSQPLKAAIPERRQKMTGQGSRSLFHSFTAPPGASILILTTVPKNHGTRDAGMIEGLSLLPFMPHPYTLASYGRAYVRLR